MEDLIDWHLYSSIFIDSVVCKRSLVSLKGSKRGKRKEEYQGHQIVLGSSIAALYILSDTE
jgi:hypothetical protein